MKFAYIPGAPPEWKLARHASCGIAAAVLMLAASQAQAACHVSPGFQTKLVEMDMGDVIVNDQMPIGTVLKERTFPIMVNPGENGLEEMAQCRLGGGQTIGTIQQGTLTNIPGVYTTAVQGIGIRLTRNLGGQEAPVVYPHTITVPAFRNPSFYPGAGFTVELIKTADEVGSGELQKGDYTNYYTDGDGPGKSLMITRLIGNGITITTPACTLNDVSKSILVDLGSVPTSEFTGPGSTSTAKPFEVKLNCVAKPKPQEIWMQFDATVDTSTTTEGVIQLDGGEGAASGVGIQVLGRGGQPVKLNTEWKDGVSAQGPYSIPFQAQYYQTEPVVRAGAANGVATFTLTYK